METVLDIDKMTLEVVQEAGKGGMTACEVNLTLSDYGIPRNAYARMERLVGEGKLEKCGTERIDNRCELAKILQLPPAPGKAVDLYTVPEKAGGK